MNWFELGANCDQSVAFQIVGQMFTNCSFLGGIYERIIADNNKSPRGTGVPKMNIELTFADWKANEASQDDPLDEAIYLVDVYRFLEAKCSQETEELEYLAQDITARAERRMARIDAARSAGQLKNVSDLHKRRAIRPPSLQRSQELSVKTRAELSLRFRVPVHIFGNRFRMRGATDHEMKALEAIHARINALLDQMEELREEIIVCEPRSLLGFCAKLSFVGETLVDADGIDPSVTKELVRQCAGQLLRLAASQPASVEKDACLESVAEAVLWSEKPDNGD